MKPPINFFHACDCCSALTSERFPIKGGSICGDCYKAFIKVSKQPLSTQTLEELNDAKQAAKERSQLVLKADSGPVPTSNRPLTTLETLQFKKFICENSGMTLAETASFLDAASDEERAELVQAFRTRTAKSINTAKASVGGPAQSLEIKVLTEDAAKPKCPKCGSIKTTFNKQGFGVGKAAVGFVLTGGIGLLAGGINANRLVSRCFDCGHTWT
jgi:hypothetical protein